MNFQCEHLGKMGKKVVIIDYKLGNLYSVQRACDIVGLHTTISSRSEDIVTADALILPGVGAFSEAMDNLNDLDLRVPIIDAAQEGIPIFGICLGLQLLFTESQEFGSHKGLNLIPGQIQKFESYALDGHSFKVPFIGWNQIQAKSESGWDSSPLSKVEPLDYMYFVHSYYASTENSDHTLSLTSYGSTCYTSSISFNNLFATQFHPEKSGSTGLAIYKAWAQINNLIA